MKEIAFDVPAPPPPSRAESADVMDLSHSSIILSEKDIHDIFCFEEHHSMLFFPPAGSNTGERETMEEHSDHAEGVNEKMPFAVNIAQQVGQYSIPHKATGVSFILLLDFSL